MNEKLRSAKNMVPKKVVSFYPSKTKKCGSEQGNTPEANKLRSALV
jgi:hypothetical protein